jgi:hypothetical protein
MESLGDLTGTEWTGPAELWLDPFGNEAEQSAATLSISGDGVSYSWSYQGGAQRGSITPRDGLERAT